jgi:hypothetical protein
MAKNHIPLQIFDCSHPVTEQQPKILLPISVATWNFLFIDSFYRIQKSHVQIN